MKEWPLVFNSAMVRATIAGRKTRASHLAVQATDEEGASTPDLSKGWGRVKPGDLLWVRESYALVPATAYRCSTNVSHRVSPDGESWAVYRDGWTRCPPMYWRSSTQMPRWASRITLEVTDNHVELLGDISEDAAVKEGMQYRDPGTREARSWRPRPGWSWNDPHPIDIDPERGSDFCLGRARWAFANLWNHQYGEGAWDRDRSQWVWVTSFKVVEGR